MNAKTVTLLLTFLLMIVPAAALTADTGVTLGDAQQEPAHNVTATFTLTNNGNTTLTNFQFISTAASVHNIYFTGVPMNITPGQQAVVTVGGSIPISFDAATNACVPSSFSIGVIDITADAAVNTTVQAQTELFMQRANHLEFKDVDIDVDEDSTSFDEGDYVDMVPGSDVAVIAEIENSYDEDDGYDIENIELFVESEDNEIDVDEDLDVDDLRPDRDTTEEITFDIDRDVDEDDYVTAVFVCGIDENNARHGDRINGFFEVEREDDFVIFRSIDGPRQAVCGDSVTYRIGVENVGEDDQDDVEVFMANERLRISDSVTGIEVEEDDTESVRFSFRLPETAQDGLTTFEISVIADDGEVTDTTTQSLTLTDCTEEEEPTPVVVPPTPVQQPVAQPIVQPLPPVGNTQVYATPVGTKGFRSSGLYIPFLILLILLAVLVILVMLRKR